jgi:DNA-binding transcriptional regulator YiaG
MSNLGSVLKNEIARVARKEIRAHAEPLRKTNVALRQQVVILKRQIGELDREVRALRRAVPAQKTVESESSSESSRIRITAKGVRSLRDRLGLSQGELGQLTGASPQSVYNWENGASPRAASLALLAGLRSIGKKEARKRLEALAAASGKRRAAASA